LITSQNADRVPWLVPIRHSRMSESLFAFYRGAAKIMASDLATTPATGLTAQICGDAHLVNFGTYAAPDRGQVFDLNDFDEEPTRSVAVKSIAAYREPMAEFAEAKTMDVWYARLSVDEILNGLTSKAHRRSVAKQAKKARSKGGLKAHAKLAERVRGKHRIKSDPPLLLPFRELPSAAKVENLPAIVESSLRSYAATLSSDCKHLLERFRFVDLAMKVVGVGSVGTRCMLVLVEGRDQDDPFFCR
jgi:uncharacterized protein (DUF2252 family)